MWEKMTVELSARLPAAARRGKAASERMVAVAALFGVSLHAAGDAHGGAGALEEVLFENLRLEIGPGDVVLITGPSGSGKSTLLRAVRRALGEAGMSDVVRPGIFDLGAAALPVDRALVDCFDLPLEGALRCLAMAGLSEARLLLRAPAELSEGQQFRFRVALFLASRAAVLVADEFCAALDRLTARVVAWQLGRFVRGSVKSERPRAAIVATSHGDLAADLGATVVVEKGFGPEAVARRLGEAL